MELDIKDDEVDASAKAYVCWDIDNLYVFIEVKDEFNIGFETSLSNPTLL